MSLLDDRTDPEVLRLEDPDPWKVIGTVVLGRYNVRRVAGRGAQAVVYQAEHTRLPLKVAIKFVAVDGSTDPSALERFRREAMILARLEPHPSTVTVHDVDLFSDGRTPLLVTEWLEGETLLQRLKRNRRTDWREAFELAAQAADALVAAHARGIVHRDVKPANLFCCRDGRVKVLDFGIAKIIGSPAADHILVPQRLTAMNALVGTTAYMSPEQVRSESDLDGRSDVYSLGAVLYNLVTARRLWPVPVNEERKIMLLIATADPVDVRTHAPEVPEHAAQVIRLALTRDRTRRPTMAQWKEQLLVASARAGDLVTTPHRRQENAPRSVIVDGSFAPPCSLSPDETTKPRSPKRPSAARARALPLDPIPGEVTPHRAPTLITSRHLPRAPTIFGRIRVALAALVASRRADRRAHRSTNRR